MDWRRDVEAARRLMAGPFAAATHGGQAHADDLLAAALIWRHRGAPLYRINAREEALALGGDGAAVLLFDIGDGWGLPERFAVLDHHSTLEEPSALVQVMHALEVDPPPPVQPFVTAIDLLDRFGPSAKRWLGLFGQSLMPAFARVFAQERGRVGDTRLLELLAEAFHARLDLEPEQYREAFRLAERLELADAAERFPRTFHSLRMMLSATHGVVPAAAGREALETGFGIDFGCYAVLAVPELEQYAVRGLRMHFGDAGRAAQAAEAGRYALLADGPVAAVALEDNVPPGPLYHALLDLGALPAEKPAVVVVRDLRNPGAYTVWRPERHRQIDLRRLQGEALFVHASGFLAVVKAGSAEEAARLAVSRLA